ncbi:MAG: nicotinate-nucleotide--dimethylbenzimidazole phosphoribosyltransferase [Solirubrobacterales bacterium]
MTEPRFTRPPTPAGFDASRASERAADPRGWRYEETDLAAVYRVIAERRDIRRFRPAEIEDDVLERVLAAAHQAPSVGLMQPWRMIVVRELQSRISMRALAQRERLRQADKFDERARHFLDQKVEGIVDAPLGICICCDHGDGDKEILGRGSIRETDVYSTACAIENLWLAARAEGLGVGWVSFYQPDDVRKLFGLPQQVEPIAYLCVGWPDERPVRPGLETAGWSQRMPLDEVVMQERWRVGDEARQLPRDQPALDLGAAAGARDRLDQLVKPTGSLGALESVIARWATITGKPPLEKLHAGVLIFAADHGHARHGTSLFGAEVSSQVAAAAARGETACGVLAERGKHELVVVDVGLAGPTPPNVRNAKIATGSADFTENNALSAEQVEGAMAAGRGSCAELSGRNVDCLILGEIGIGNTATTAALTSAVLKLEPSRTVGRGTGVDASGFNRKVELVSRALETRDLPMGPTEALITVGGLEFAAMVGAMIEATKRALPIVIDGYAVTVAALIATRMDPAVAEYLFASHRSAEPGHELLLTELGLEPILDLRLRLGEGSGSLLALPIIEACGALHANMATFEESGVSRNH